MGEIRKLKSSRGGDPPRESTPRRLAAIVAGDIAGYSRLMQIDEEGTHLRVKRIERDLIEPSIVGHHGRLVKTTGDGFIAIFDSPVEAVRCGIVIQQNMVGRNASMPKHHWIEYRIGVNLGDVIVEADDVFGDGVNIATRLEGIADPGQVYISGGIYEQIKHKLVCGYESLGDRKVKNINRPGESLPGASGSGGLQQDPEATREYSDFFAEPYSAGHRWRRPLVPASATAWQGGEPGVSPGLASGGDAERALTAGTSHETSSTATSACSRCGANPAASGATAFVRSSGGASHPTSGTATSTRVSRHARHTAGLCGPRARDEHDPRRQLHNG